MRRWFQDTVARVLAGGRGRLGRVWVRTRARLLPWLHRGVVIGQRVDIGRSCDFRITDGGRLEVGDDAAISCGCLVTVQRGNLVIGCRTFIGPFTTIAVQREILIGDDVLVAERVTIRDQDHAIHGSESVMISGGRFELGTVRIESGAWIGAGAVLLRGISVGEGAVVAANAVVRSNIPANAIAAGVPARIVGFRRLA